VATRAARSAPAPAASAVLAGAVRPDDQQLAAGRGPGDVAQQGDGAVVGPVQVVEQQQHRALRRTVEQVARDAVEQA
jgi:hypothetical protein